MTENTNTLSAGRVFSIVIIFVGASFAWLLFGQILSKRNKDSSQSSKSGVAQLWGPEQSQKHIKITTSPEKHSRTRKSIQPISSLIVVKLDYDPKKKGLTWNNTYKADFVAKYKIKNSYDREQFFNLSFSLPSLKTSYHDFKFKIDGQPIADLSPSMGTIEHKLLIGAGKTISVDISYESRGVDQWSYHLGEVGHIQNFRLNMETNFEKIDFPVGASSPTLREHDDISDRWSLSWDYSDVIRPQHIAMQMPKIKDAGKIASRVSFFAPVSLLFFFAIVLIFTTIKRINLHPMNYIFLAAGFFSFHLLFAYLANVIPLHLAFLISAISSLALIGSYVHACSEKELMKIALPAQFAYLVLFSYSFLFEGLTGLTLAIGSIITLSIVMRATAKVDWAKVFTQDLAKQKSRQKSTKETPAVITPEASLE